MKHKNIIGVCLLICLFSVDSMAQRQAIKFNPLGLLFGIANVSYERVIDDNSAFEIGAGYTRYSATINGTEDASVTGFGFSGAYKFYIGRKKEAPRGIYIAPNASYAKASGEANGESGDVDSFIVGAMFGNQWVWGEGGGFVLDLGIGIANYSISASDNVESVNFEGILPQARLAIGYAF